MIVMIGGEKGGTGKSTVASNLAVWLSHQGRDVLLLDADPQGTAAKWVERRNEYHDDKPKVHCIQKHGSIFEAVKDAATRYEDVIIDAGGRDSEELRTGMVGAQKLYVPLRASQPDLETSVRVAELVKLARGFNPDLEAYALISLAPTNPAIREAEEARELLSELADLQMADTFVRERKVYRDAMIEGLGVIEGDNPKARLEIEALAIEIFGDAYLKTAGAK